MTASEASEFWKFRYDRTKNYVDEHWETSELKEHNEYVSALKTAIEALEKQIPKKPDIHPCEENGVYATLTCCPTCGDIVEVEYNKCCGNCGQKLGWGDDE